MAIPHPDVSYGNREPYADETLVFTLATVGAPWGATSVPRHEDWTYYLVTRIYFESYDSPYEATPRTEDYTARWYHFGLTGAPRYPLFLQDDGDEAEMEDLDGSVRMRPPPEGDERSYRIVLTVHDERIEWRNYAFSPGVTVSIGEFEFVDP